jgi:FAD/FMN-containing dehydrogenase
MAVKKELAGVVSPRRISDDPAALESYARDESFVHPMKPHLVVKPASADEVTAIVAWARDTGTPLVPVSSGPPHGRGDTVPSVPEAVIIDLSGLKKIMRIDRRNKVAMIEAGVTYPQLQPELAKAGLRLDTPLLPRANKSVVASLLEREPTLIPRVKWASLDPLRCTEIIWGDGHKLVTGDAGNWTSMEEAFRRKQAPVGPTGPGQADFYRFVSAAQGSLGIVTWASVRCEVLPDPHKLGFVLAKRADDLLDFVYRVLRFRYADELFILNNAGLAYVLGGKPARVRALTEELPPWVALVGIAGRDILPEERVAYQEKDIGGIAQQFGLKLLPAVPGAGSGEVLRAILNPSPEPYWKNGARNAYQEIFFLTTLNRTPDFIATMNAVAEAEGYPVADIGVYIQPLHQGVNCHCEFILPYDRENPREAARMQTLFTRASEALLKEGAFFSRPYGPWASLAYNRDARTTAVLKKLKGIFDPAGVMNPGKLCF